MYLQPNSIVFGFKDKSILRGAFCLFLQKTLSEKQEKQSHCKMNKEDRIIPYSNYRWDSTIRKEGTYGYTVHNNYEYREI